MKRSEINDWLGKAEQFFSSMRFTLPPFAFFSENDWKEKAKDSTEIFDNGLGWDITDFGSGDFLSCGLLLFTLRNGKLSTNPRIKPYAEKIMIVQEGQRTPWHHHDHKMEDIINRGGGKLIIELIENSVVQVDGIKRTIPTDGKLILHPGESVCLLQGMDHSFYAMPGHGPVLLGEVSMVNDDASDNFFRDKVGRFPTIEEDTPPRRLLVTDYKERL